MLREKQDPAAVNEPEGGPSGGTERVLSPPGELVSPQVGL